MKKLTLALLCNLLPVLPALAGSPPASLEELRGKARILLVSAPSAASAAVQRQQALFLAEAGPARDRDLVLIELHTLKNSAQIRQRLQIPADRFTVLLLGKDGGEKARSATPVALPPWFALIDTMPMRRAEMRATQKAAD